MALVSEGAVPKGNRAPDPERTREAMGPQRVATPRRNPSTDQKKVRRQMGLQQGAQSQQHTAATPAPDPRFGTPPAHDHWGDVGKEFGQCQTCQGQGRDYHNRPCAACGGSGSRRIAVRVEATMTENWAERLNPGDQISLPNGKTQKVQRIRHHETDSQRVYVDTDGGTALVNRRQTFQVVPHNSRQQSTPGYGRPGGNSNTMPFGGHGGQSGTNEKAKGSTQCPSCGRNGTLQQRGDHYQCSHCGYQESFGGAGGSTFTDRESIVGAPSRDRGGLNPTASLIARRARAVLAQEEQA